MSSYTPKFDECRGCKFFRKSRPLPICKHCGAGEFFEEKDPDVSDPDVDRLMRIYDRMTSDADGDRTIPHESEAVQRADEGENADR